MKTTSIIISLSIAAVPVACDTERKPEQTGNQHPAAEEERARAAEPGPTGMTNPGTTAERQPVVGQRGMDRQMDPARGDDPEDRAEDAKEAARLVDDAAKTLNQMKSNPNLLTLMKQAKGVFIVPNYGRAALGVGVRGGEGVLMVRQSANDQWSAPAFYEIGGISLGAQVGGEGGNIAMLLMSDESLESFKGDDTFTINADAKLTLADFSTLSEAAMGKGKDVIFWSDTAGAFAGVALGVTDIDWDDEENPAYHGREFRAKDLFEGKARSTGGKRGLEQALSGI